MTLEPNEPRFASWPRVKDRIRRGGWGPAALAEARRLIDKHGYGRRLEELADAEEAAKGWG